MDLVIKNACIYDGSGGKPFSASLAITAGKIERVGKFPVPPGTPEIDASGLAVSAGFIDVHHHADRQMHGGIAKNPEAQNIVMQGVTTIVAGNCGGSPLSIGEHLNEVEKANPAINYSTLIGFQTIKSHLGIKGNASTDQLRQMTEILDEALSQGAVGMSSGRVRQSDELIQMARVLAEQGKVYAVHMVSQGPAIFASIAQTGRISRETGCRTEISHLKCSRKCAWGKARQVLEAIEEENAAGADLTFDQYPYTAWYAGISGVLPKNNYGKEALERREPEVMKLAAYGIAEVGGAQNIKIANCKFDPSLEGKTVADIAAERGVDEVETLLDIILSGRTSGIVRSMNEEDVKTIMPHPLGLVASDGQVRKLGVGVCHPRNYGTFPRVLGKYVREEKVLSLEEAIRKMTSFPAMRFGFSRRGLIKEGFIADITIFDPEKIIDMATFDAAHQHPQGIEYVLVSGQIVVEKGSQTQARPGSALRL